MGRSPPPPMELDELTANTDTRACYISLERAKKIEQNGTNTNFNFAFLGKPWPPKITTKPTIIVVITNVMIINVIIFFIVIITVSLITITILIIILLLLLLFL